MLTNENIHRNSLILMWTVNYFKAWKKLLKDNNFSLNWQLKRFIFERDERKVWQDVLSPFSDNSDIKEADWQTRSSFASDKKATDPVRNSIWQAETSNERDHTELNNVISQLSTAIQWPQVSMWKYDEMWSRSKSFPNKLLWKQFLSMYYSSFYSSLSLSLYQFIIRKDQ